MKQKVTYKWTNDHKGQEHDSRDWITRDLIFDDENYSFGDWLTDEGVSFDMDDYGRYCVLDDGGGRTGEVYRLIDEVEIDNFVLLMTKNNDIFVEYYDSITQAISGLNYEVGCLTKSDLRKTQFTLGTPSADWSSESMDLQEVLFDVDFSKFI